MNSIELPKWYAQFVRDWIATFGVDDGGQTARELARWYPTVARREYTAEELNAAIVRIVGGAADVPAEPSAVCDRLEIEVREMRQAEIESHLAMHSHVELSF